jgi:ribosomal protein S18 acetylase RimI-like enzyme
LRELSRHEVERLLADRRDELVAVWPEARLDELLPWHRGREGFRLICEEDRQGRLAGLAYGYRGAAGQWWHDLVSAAMTEGQRRDWLQPAHFELVELAVRPDLRGRGLGGRLHDAVLADLDAPTAVLSTETDNEAALGLYRGRGWQLLVRELDFGAGRLFCVLGLDLARE